MRNFSHSLSSLMLLLGCMFSIALNAKSETIHSATPKLMKLVPDLNGHWFLDGKLEFGCDVTYSNGGKRRTAGYLNGNLLWSDFYCESEQATFDNGVFYVDMMAVARNNQSLVIHARMRDYPIVKASFIIKIPPIESIRVEIPKREKLRYGNIIEPWVSITYANGVVYVHEPTSLESLISPDSIDLYFNQTRILDGRITLPEYTLGSDHAFTVSAMWRSKPWINDVQHLTYHGKDDCEVKFFVGQGMKGANQADAPLGMTGAEGYYGMKGADGIPVEVRVYLSADSTTLHVDAQCGVRSVQRKLDPREASFTLIARGGKGGAGGSGGDGGNAPLADPYAAGYGGKGGKGGQGGKGSSVKILCSASAQQFLPCLVIDNSGGDGGDGGKCGRGGAYATVSGAPTLLQLLFPSRNYSGDDGEQGEQGESGGEAVIEIVD